MPSRLRVRDMGKPGTPGNPADVPKCPPGWTTAPPDFIGVGATRSGTTWWHELIIHHPRVTLAPGSQKELYFFDVQWKTDLAEHDIARYNSYFPRPPGCIAGEWTPDYMYHTWVPPLLRRVAPDAAILVGLRDPVERYLSEIRHWLTLGLDSKILGTVSDVAQFRSYYAYPLLRLLEYFPRDRVLILQMERCELEPESQLRRTYEFLGLEDVDFVPDVVRRRVNTTSRDVEVPSPLLLVPEAGFRRDAQLLREIEPELDLSLWPSVS